jgi:hypothetical protein
MEQLEVWSNQKYGASRSMVQAEQWSRQKHGVERSME